MLTVGESKVVREMLYYSCNSSLRLKLFKNKNLKENMTIGNFRYFCLFFQMNFRIILSMVCIGNFTGSTPIWCFDKK